MSLKSLCSISSNNPHLYTVTFKCPRPSKQNDWAIITCICCSACALLPLTWTVKTELTPALLLWAGNTIYKPPGWGFMAHPQWWMQNSCRCTKLGVQTVSLISRFFLPQGLKSFSIENLNFPSKSPVSLFADFLVSWPIHSGGCCTKIINLPGNGVGLFVIILCISLTLQTCFPSSWQMLALQPCNVSSGRSVLLSRGDRWETEAQRWLLASLAAVWSGFRCKAFQL